LAAARDFEDFYRAEYPLVFRAALAFSGRHEEALDATQEAFRTCLCPLATASR
jgi:DNA-directed RNA polymerase specialized sigma24 family protein